MPEFSDDVLILVGHGSTDRPAARAGATFIAETVRERRLFKAVHAGFLKHPPFAKDLLKAADGRRVFLVPHMAHAGFITRTVIPRDLNLAGAETVRAGADSGAGTEQTVYLCDPVGAHPAIPELIRDRLEASLRAHGIDPMACAVILVGHGGGLNGVSARHTQTLADTVAALGAPLSVRALFLEQEPYLRDWTAAIDRETVVVTPVLMSGGLHGAEDIPAAFGVAPGAVRFGKNNGAMAGPFKSGSRTVWLQPPLGDDPAIADIALAQVQGALGRRAD
jgi:sirohydrochlorin cobaltochelatase